MKKILVTGGAGFLGSNLCKWLLDLGHNVICMDNFYTGRKENIEAFHQNERFTFLQHDVIEALPGALEIDEIYNLACPASPPHYQKDPIYTTKVNVLGILNVLDLAKMKKAKILHTSTSEIYGEPEVHPQVESYRGNVNPIGIRSCYDEGKRCAESLIFDYYRQFGVKAKIIRIFNTYGTNMDPADGRVISNFIMQALQGQAITVYGNGLQTRSLCYVDDLIEGMIKMMEAEDGVVGPVNLGNPEEYTVLEIAKKIIELTGSQSELIYRDLPQDDPTQRRPDIRLAEKFLNWHPRTSVEDGLKKTIEYFKNQLL